MPTVEIGAADHGDFDRWPPLWNGYQCFFAVDILEAVTATIWARFLDPSEPIHIAERSGVL